MYEDMTMMQKFLFITDFPFCWLRKLSIPPSEEKDYDNYLVIAWPWFGIPILLMLATASTPSLIWFPIYIPFAALWSYLFHKYS